MPDYSLLDPDVLAFVLIPAALVAAFAWGIAVASHRLGEARVARRRAVIVLAGGAAWMAAWWLIASAGVLRRWAATPPPFVFLVAGVVAMSLLIAGSRYGHRLALGLPLWGLIAIQAFRLPLELAMHAMYERGIMPAQMSYTGLNFDIVTGATALVVAAAVRGGRARWAAVIWNVMGLALLANIVVISILSTPRIQYFGPERLNTWVADPPFVWLPAVMVVAALAGHLLVARALRLTRRA